MSNINFLGINENFPVAGQDNDTQTFRDNFDTIKNSLRIARDEITELEDSAARLNQDNDFELNVIQNAVLENVREQKWEGGEVPLAGAPSNLIVIDFKNGSYQIYKFVDDVNLSLLNFPGDNQITPPEDSPVGVGKVTLELYGDNTPRTINFTLSDGAIIKKNSSFPSSLVVESSEDPIFIEVWRHSTSTFFMNYLGQFS